MAHFADMVDLVRFLQRNVLLVGKPVRCLRGHRPADAWAARDDGKLSGALASSQGAAIVHVSRAV